MMYHTTGLQNAVVPDDASMQRRERQAMANAAINRRSASHYSFDQEQQQPNNGSPYQNLPMISENDFLGNELPH